MDDRAVEILSSKQSDPKAQALIEEVRARMRSAKAMDQDGNITDREEAATYLIETVVNQGRAEGFSAVDGKFMT